MSGNLPGQNNLPSFRAGEVDAGYRTGSRCSGCPVFVNRIWQHLLGEGLVRTPNDFGLQGERPLHPELLDWLAQQLVHSGSIKEIIRLITASSVYQQGYDLDEVTVETDPDNRYFSRPLKRMESEILRDSMLAISGNLNPEMFGPGIKPLDAPRCNCHWLN